MEKRFLSVLEFAAVLGIGKSTAWKMVWEKQVRCIRAGHRVLIPIAAVEELETTHLETSRGDGNQIR
mgnify:CR=1 FL=1|jgi:excisionase family DNA binding protein|tara:strand:+ start:319 stop:519 length:201 start_codon:yes stop_codon:yes gene_type:complete